MYYERMHEKVKIVMMQCDLDSDTCFCVSMGTNKDWITTAWLLSVRTAH